MENVGKVFERSEGDKNALSRQPVPQPPPPPPAPSQFSLHRSPRCSTFNRTPGKDIQRGKICGEIWQGLECRVQLFKRQPNN